MEHGKAVNHRLTLAAELMIGFGEYLGQGNRSVLKRPHVAILPHKPHKVALHVTFNNHPKKYVEMDGLIAKPNLHSNELPSRSYQ
jgi:hypothetical protein